jgi:hypothetical protein
VPDTPQLNESVARAIAEADALLTEMLDGPSGGTFYGVGPESVPRGKLLTVRATLRKALGPTP